MIEKRIPNPMAAAQDCWSHVSAAERCAAEAEKAVHREECDQSEAFSYLGHLHLEIAKFKDKVYSEAFMEGGPSGGEAGS